jgi:hypothetical protein
MGDRPNMLVCQFDPKSLQITAYNIHEWIHATMHLQAEDIRTIQIDGPQRRVYIKFVEHNKVLDNIQRTNGPQEYRHDTGEISIVHVEIAGPGTKKVLIANLPPEIPDRKRTDLLTKYGDVKNITEEQWGRQYR